MCYFFIPAVLLCNLVLWPKLVAKVFEVILQCIHAEVSIGCSLMCSLVCQFVFQFVPFDAYNILCDFTFIKVVLRFAWALITSICTMAANMG